MPHVRRPVPESGRELTAPHKRAVFPSDSECHACVLRRPQRFGRGSAFLRLHAVPVFGVQNQNTFFHIFSPSAPRLLSALFLCLSFFLSLPFFFFFLYALILPLRFRAVRNGGLPHTSVFPVSPRSPGRPSLPHAFRIPVYSLTSPHNPVYCPAFYILLYTFRNFIYSGARRPFYTFLYFPGLFILFYISPVFFR